MQIYAKDCIPDGDEFKAIIFLYLASKESGNQDAIIKSVIKLCENDLLKCIKYTVISIILHWNELTEELKKLWLQKQTVAEIKDIIQALISEYNQFKNCVEGLCYPVVDGLIESSAEFLELVKNLSTNITVAQPNSQSGFYMISAYDSKTDYSGQIVKGARRHIRVGKKRNGVYSVIVDSAELSSPNNLFVFDDLKEINNFIDNVKAGMAQTRRPVQDYFYNIVTKPYPIMKYTDINTDFVKVQTTCGPAYICKYSTYCEE